MKVLSFDTTNNGISVAILSNKKIISSFDTSESSTQSEILIPAIEECLNKANIWYQDLDLVAFTNGPGSFTGVRVGFSAAKAIKLATKLPVICINSLEAVAYGCLKPKNKGSMVIVMDAKLDEFFIQEFEIFQNTLKPSYEPTLIKSDIIQDYLPEKEFLLAGDAKNLVKKQLRDCEFSISQENDKIEAINIALLAQEMLDNGFNPGLVDIIYIRKPQISKRKK